MTYRYNVVVEVGIDTAKMNSGNQAQKEILRSMENDVVNSQRRIDAELGNSIRTRQNLERQYSEFNSQEIGRRQLLRQRDYEQQIAQTRSNAQELLQQEIRSNQSLASENSRNAQRRFQEQRTAYENEQALLKANLANKLQREETYAAESAALQKRLATSDPFQSLGSRQQSLSGAGQSVSAFANAQPRFDPIKSFNAQVLQKDPFQSLGNRNLSLGQASKDLADYEKTLKNTTGSLGLFGQAFKGAFVGAITGFAVREVIGSITGFFGAIEDGIASSIKLAGTFQETTNALAVFSGSVSSAKNELRDIDKIALETPGLTLESAEKGYQRLRALNFEAKVSQDLIRGLGTQRVLSGASSDAVDRVVTNLIQLKSGAGTSRDVRESIGQLPTLLPIFQKAFGTQDFGQINKIFKESPNAIKIFSAELAKAEKAQSGLNVALENFTDTGIQVAREFGSPLLDPLTDDVKLLTSLLSDSIPIVKAWGESLADALTGFSTGLVAIDALLSGKSGGSGTSIGDILNPRAGLSLLSNATGAGKFIQPIADGFNFFQQIGESKRIAARKNQPSFGTSNVDRTSIATFLDPKTNTLRFESDSEKRIRLQASDVKDAETSKKEILKTLKEERDQQTAINDSYYKTEEARLTTHLDYTTAQELNTARKVSSNKVNSLQADIKTTNDYYSDLIKFGNLDKVETIKAKGDLNNELIKLNGSLNLEILKQEKQELEFQKKFEDERRRDAIESKNLELREIKSLNDKQTFDLQQVIDKDLVNSADGYARLRDLTVEGSDQVAQVTRERYAEQLTDKSLTDTQIINLTKQRDLDLRDLAEETRRKLIEIDKAQYETRLKNIDEFYNNVSQKLSSQADTFSSLSGALNPQNVNDKLVSNISNTLFGGIDFADKEKSIQSQIAALQDLNKTLDKSTDAYSFNDYALQKLEGSLTQLQKSYPKLQEDIFKTVKGYNEGTVSIEEFQKAQLDLFDGESVLRIEKYQVAIDDINAKIKTATESPSDVPTNIKQLNKDLNTAIDAKVLAQFEEGQKRGKLYADTIQGLTEDLADYQNRDAQTVSKLNDSFKIDLLKEAKQQYEEIFNLEYRIANSPLIDNLEIEIAKRRDVLDLRHQETEAIIASNRAEAELAKSQDISTNQIRAQVLGHLAEQKTLNTAIADGIIKIYDTAAGKIDKLLDKSVGKIPIIGDIVKQQSRNALSNFTKTVLNKFLPSELTDSLNSTGDLKLDEAKKQTDLLKTIAGNTSATATITNNFKVTGQQGAGGSGGGIAALANIFGSLFGRDKTGSTNSNGEFVVNGKDAPPGNGGQVAGILDYFNADGSSIGDGKSGKSGILSSIFGKGGIFGADGFGNNKGTYSAAGAGASILGGVISSNFGGSAIGRRLGGALSGAGTGLQIGALFGGPVGAAIGAGIGAIVGFFTSGGQRKKDEKARTEYINDAFAALDKLIEQVNNDQIDGGQAIQQADGIRTQYLNASGALKDTKTRNIALKDVSRLDSKIEQLKTAVAAQTARKQRLELYAPTFADGGSLSKFSSNNYTNNPLGYQKGGQKLGYFPASGQHAIYNEKGSEYIFDHETTRNIGVDKLDLIRQTKGQVLNSMLFRLNDVQKKADGGTLIQVAQQAGTAQSASNAPINVTIQVDGSAFGTMLAQALAVTIQQNNGSPEQINALSKGIENEGQTKLVQMIAEQVLTRLKG